jgi:hypothetical protein
MHGAKSKTAWVRGFYTALGPVLTGIRKIWPDAIVTTEHVGLAMLRVARTGYPKKILESADIRAAGQ